MKNKAALQRREKKMARRKAERRDKKRPGALQAKIAPLPGYETYTDEDHAFWTAHGINFLASDFANGLWAPVFPGIYEGKSLTLDEVGTKIVSLYRRPNGSWDMTHKAEIAWALQSKLTAYTFLFEARRRLAATDHETDVLLPRQGQVWAFFDFVRNEIIKEPVKHS